MKYLKAFNTHSEYQTYINRGNTVLPNVSICREEGDVHYNEVDYSKIYLTTVARESGTISFNIRESVGTDILTSISYSLDKGNTWTTTLNQDNKEGYLVIDVDVQASDEILWKGIGSQLSAWEEDCYLGSFFSSDCMFDAKGNIMSLLFGDNFINQTTIGGIATFTNLFEDNDEEKFCNIVNAKDLILPAITLTEECYQFMFRDCTLLETAPALPATTLADGCYDGMFEGCVALTKAPASLPATTLADGCYEGMFRGCTSLISAPELSATTLAYQCCRFMFEGCTSLISAPSILPATTLVEECYQSMFYGCTSLTTAPELPATTLEDFCYDEMFYGCSNLNYIKALFTTTPRSLYTYYWVDGVAASGTFVKNSAANWNVTGVHGIPSGWTIQTANS